MKAAALAAYLVKRAPDYRIMLATETVGEQLLDVGELSIFDAEKLVIIWPGKLLPTVEKED